MSIEAVHRSFSQRLALNSQILKNKYWMLPVDDKGHGSFVPVGRGVRSSEFCGRFMSLMVCKNVDAHHGVFLGEVDVTGKVVVHLQHMWCKNSSCPVCFIRGWAIRGARAVENRINAGVKLGLGCAEHVTVSVPVAERDLPEPIMRKKCRDALFDRGITGGCMIFHGYRIDRYRDVLTWSPHYHSLCFIEGGFDRCRNCVHAREDCANCSGLKGKEVRGFKRDGYLVKVHDVRETIFGSAHYQLNHATVKLGIRRFQVTTWFGLLSCCKKLPVEKPRAHVVCPACEAEMTRCVHLGKRYIVKDVGSPDYVPLFVDDEFDVDGSSNYPDAVHGSWG